MLSKITIALLIFSLLLLFCQNTISKDISATKSSGKHSADRLIDKLKIDDMVHNEEIITVEGIIAETNIKNRNLNILIKSERHENHYIICEMNMAKDYTKRDLSKGKEIVIKGRLKGYLNDVIIMNCLLVNTLNNE